MRRQENLVFSVNSQISKVKRPKSQAKPELYKPLDSEVSKTEYSVGKLTHAGYTLTNQSMSKSSVMHMS